MSAEGDGSQICMMRYTGAYFDIHGDLLLTGSNSIAAREIILPCRLAEVTV